MKIQLIRHATLLLNVNNKKILVDPMLNMKGTLAAIENVPNTNKNPLVDLPVPVEAIIFCDAIIVTHTHRDHFNAETAELISKEIPVFCQPEDEVKIIELGFNRVIPVIDSIEWEGIQLIRTRGRHGHGAIAAKMAPVSGFIISSANEPITYLTGDTVWCSYVKNALIQYKPEIIIGYCGEAKFSIGKAITLNAQDILTLCTQASFSKVIAVHMEAWNHCRLSRKDLREFVINHQIEDRVYIPEDGEIIEVCS